MKPIVEEAYEQASQRAVEVGLLPSELAALEKAAQQDSFYALSIPLHKRNRVPTAQDKARDWFLRTARELYLWARARQSTV